MGLDELLDALRAITADDVESVGGYADDIARLVGDMRSGADASIAEANEALAARDAEIQRLQAENYKLMTALGSAIDAEPGPEPTGEGEGEEVDDFDISDYIEKED